MLVYQNGTSVKTGPDRSHHEHWKRIVSDADCQAIRAIMWVHVNTITKLSFTANDIVACDRTGIIKDILDKALPSQPLYAERFVGLLLWDELDRDECHEWVVENHFIADARDVHFARPRRWLVDEGRLLQRWKSALVDHSMQRFNVCLKELGVSPGDTKALRLAAQDLRKYSQVGAVWSMLARQIAVSPRVINAKSDLEGTISTPRVAKQHEAVLDWAVDEVVESLGAECLSMLEISCERIIALRNLAGAIKLDTTTSLYFHRLSRSVLFGFDIESCIICRAILDLEFAAIVYRGKSIDEYCETRYKKRGMNTPRSYGLADRIWAAYDPTGLIDEDIRKEAYRLKRVGDQAVHVSSVADVHKIFEARLNIFENIKTLVNVIQSIRAKTDSYPSEF